MAGRSNASPYGGAWTGPIFRAHASAPRPRQDDPATTFVSEGIEEGVATAVAAAQGKDVVLFGATVPRLALAHGLVDEILVHLALNRLGDGTCLFGSPGAGRTALEKIGVWDEGR